MKTKLAASALFLLMGSMSSVAAERPVKCAVESAGVPAFHGSCFFQSEKGGSFTLRSAKKGADLVEDISSVSVDVVAKDVAEVRGLTSSGMNSRWGDARRSNKERACWVGADFRVCAW